MQKSGDFPLFAAKILVASSLKMWHNSPVQIHICSGIEVVITELTRNQFGSNPTRVRIPPAAPKRKASPLGGAFSFYKGIRTREGPGERKTFRGTVLEQCIEIKKLLIASINTAKKG